MAGAVPAVHGATRLLAQMNPAPGGPFQATHASLDGYEVPAWYRDAKFGIWAHWGPQSAPEAGDWYARNMYMQGSEQYDFHVAHYGHPSKFGFKDVINTWKGDQFDPEHLVGLYKKAGARYFVSMGVHHDNFDMWNSKHQRWNVTKLGIKRDVVGEFKKAARNNNLRFGVSDHLWISYKWFAVSHMSDKTGPLAGVPYDGVNPANADLYHSYDDPKLITAKLDWNDVGIPDSWKAEWLLRIKDLVDQAEPDYLYSDGPIPFGDRGLELAAYLYNQSARKHGGKTEAVYTSKRTEDCAKGACVLDHERSVIETMSDAAWQTDTCVGDWHYKKGIQYKTPKIVVDMLVDVVSRGGNLLLNFPLPNSGMLDSQELGILEEITKWNATNGEAIFATRPWKIYGFSPTPLLSDQSKEDFNEKLRRELTAEDVRFTTQGKTLYAFVMGVPDKSAKISSLGIGGSQNVGKIENVELLGHPGKLTFQQDASGLTITLPEEKPARYALAFKIAGAI